jgi:hypothetical protein
VIGSDSYFNSPTQYGVLVHPFTIILAMKQRNFIPETVYGGPFLSKRFLILFFFSYRFFFGFGIHLLFLRLFTNAFCLGLGWVRLDSDSDSGFVGISGPVQMSLCSYHWAKGVEVFPCVHGFLSHLLSLHL